MKIIHEPLELQKELKDLKNKHSIGFVPTMGALHQGHISLIQQSQKENGLTVVSIYVNPTQFNDPKDFEKYPSNLEADIDLLKQLKVDYLFNPSYEQIYPDDFEYVVFEKTLSQKLCGQSRPGHFDGVLTIVLKLLNIVQAHHAYFGEKDFQQFSLIKKMAEAFFIPTQIKLCPTVRDQKGLALSSRNVRLSPHGFIKAQFFAETLKSKRTKKEVWDQLKSSGIEIDYLEEFDDRRFAAVRIENVRLIDNVTL